MVYSYTTDKILGMWFCLQKASINVSLTYLREVIQFSEGISLVLFYSERYQDSPDKMLIKVDEINFLAEAGSYT